MERAAFIILCFVSFASICSPAVAGESILTAELQMTGQFGSTSLPPDISLPDKGKQTTQLFGCWSPSNDFRGTFVTGYFTSPVDFGLYLSGFPNHTGILMFLERPDGVRLQLRTRLDPSYGWHIRSWRLDPEWTGKLVRLRVENQVTGDPFGWVGISLPIEYSSSFLDSIATSGFRIAQLWYLALILFVPGMGAAFRLRKWLVLDGPGIIALMLIVTGFLGYVSFWLYFLNPRAGKAFGIAAVLFGLVLVVRYPSRDLWRPLALPALAIMLSAGAYCCFDFLYFIDADPNVATERRFFAYTLPPDNLLPYLVADRLYEGASLRPELLPGWQTSDRPPLQAGLIDMIRPLSTRIEPTLQYQLAGIALQCSWILALWVLLRRMGFQNSHIIPVLGFAVFSGFGFFHSVYVWPKLLGASFVILGLSFVLPSEPPRPVLAGLCFGLGILSHTGVGLTLPGFALLFWFERKRFSWRPVAVAVFCGALLLIPWTLFQRFYDPPGDHLLKANLTGDMTLSGPLSQALTTAYRKLTVTEVIRRRLLDLRNLFLASPELYSLGGFQNRVNSFINEDFFALFHAIGLLNIGLLFRLLPVWRAVPEKGAFRTMDRFLLCVAVSILFWIVIMFEPGATVIHQGSLANVLLLMAGFGLYVSCLYPRGVYVLLAAQCLLVFPVFVFSKRLVERLPGTLFDGQVDPGALVIGLWLCCFLVFLGVRELRLDRLKLLPSAA